MGGMGLEMCTHFPNRPVLFLFSFLFDFQCSHTPTIQHTDALSRHGVSSSRSQTPLYRSPDNPQNMLEGGRGGVWERAGQL